MPTPGRSSGSAIDTLVGTFLRFGVGRAVLASIDNVTLKARSALNIDDGFVQGGPPRNTQIADYSTHEAARSVFPYPYIGNPGAAGARLGIVTPLGNDTSFSTGVAVTSPGFIYATPFTVALPCTATSIACKVIGNVAGNVRLGIYSAITTGPGGMADIYPVTLLFDSGNLSTATAGARTAACNVPLTEGKLYYAAITADGAGGQTFATPGFTTLIPVWGVDSAMAGIVGASFGVAAAFGALPNPFPAGATVGTFGGPPYVCIGLSLAVYRSKKENPPCAFVKSCTSFRPSTPSLA
jgi:hypothetical protein